MKSDAASYGPAFPAFRAAAPGSGPAETKGSSMRPSEFAAIRPCLEQAILDIDAFLDRLQEHENVLREMAELYGQQIVLTDADGIKTLPHQWPRPAGFNPKKEYYPDFSVCHIHSDGKTPGLNHKLALECVQNQALKLGVDIRYQTPAVQLIREQNGRVTGVIARDKAGNYVKFNAHKAVILCTGDYGNNPWMMEKYCAPAAEVARENNIYMTRSREAKRPFLQQSRMESCGRLLH